MGALNSKISPSSEMLPTIEHCNGTLLDPRSPTPYINRSPISLESGMARVSITKVKDLTPDLTHPETTLQTPINLLPKRFQSIVDPRSPSTFTRTPLVVDPCSVGDCSLTTVVSSLQYGECSIVLDDDNSDAAFKECNPELAELCNQQIVYDDSTRIVELTDEKEETIFEDAEVVPFAGNDPRSPCIAIARTPMVLVEDDDENIEANGANLESTAQTIAKPENQQHTPPQGILDSSARGEQTPKKDKSTPSGIKAGNRTPLGCVTNVGTLSNIRKMALIGQMKKSIVGVADEQKLLTRSGNSSNAELNVPTRNIRRSRIPKLRLS